MRFVPRSRSHENTGPHACSTGACTVQPSARDARHEVPGRRSADHAARSSASEERRTNRVERARCRRAPDDASQVTASAAPAAQDPAASVAGIAKLCVRSSCTSASRASRDASARAAAFARFGPRAEPLVSVATGPRASGSGVVPSAGSTAVVPHAASLRASLGGAHRSAFRHRRRRARPRRFERCAACAARFRRRAHDDRRRRSRLGLERAHALIARYDARR